MTDTKIDLEDQALRQALAGYEPAKIQRALRLIASGKIEARSTAAHAAIWLMPSERTNDVYLVVDDRSYGVWCNCPDGVRTLKCKHSAAAIMLRVHAEHAPSNPWERVSKLIETR